MYFVAKRIYQGGEAGRVSASAVRIATAGVAIGILVMLISICVTVGFQREIKERIASLIGHVQVINSQSQYRTYSLPVQLTDSLTNEILSIPGVNTLRRFVLCPGMLKTDTEFRGIIFRGIEDGSSSQYISNNLVSGTLPSFRDDATPSDSILVSATVASALQVNAGERIYAYFFDEGLKVRRFTIAGIFRTDMADFDSKMCYADLRTIQRLSKWESDQYSGAEIILDDFNSLEAVAADLSSHFRMRDDDYGQFYASPRVDEMFPQIFSWLTLLDTNVVAILILMICVAGVTMVSGLLIIILERTQFIGIMKAMGATNGQMRRTFLYLAAMIVVRGLFYGNLIALVLLFLQKQTHILKLDPHSYYLSYVPVHFQWVEMSILNIITFIVCLLILIVPSYVISRVHPARSIRFE